MTDAEAGLHSPAGGSRDFEVYNSVKKLAQFNNNLSNITSSLRSRLSAHLPLSAVPPHPQSYPHRPLAQSTSASAAWCRPRAPSPLADHLHLALSCSGFEGPSGFGHPQVSRMGVHCHPKRGLRWVLFSGFGAGTCNLHPTPTRESFSREPNGGSSSPGSLGFSSSDQPSAGTPRQVLTSPCSSDGDQRGARPDRHLQGGSCAPTLPAAERTRGVRRFV